MNHPNMTQLCLRNRDKLLILLFLLRKEADRFHDRPLSFVDPLGSDFAFGYQLVVPGL